MGTAARKDVRTHGRQTSAEPGRFRVDEDETSRRGSVPRKTGGPQENFVSRSRRARENREIPHGAGANIIRDCHTRRRVGAFQQKIKTKELVYNIDK